MKNLMIVESGSKANTIEQYLNTPDVKKKFGVFKVKASFGHVRDLAKKSEGTQHGIDVENWIAKYELIPDKMQAIKSLKSAIDEADIVWLAADMDREGEAIAWHLREVFKLKKYRRITFNEITREAIITALNSPRDIDFKLVDAQQGRRILDRLIGFKLTQLLWKNFDAKSTMSAGRVQSVLLAIICQHEQNIKEFVSTAYWNFNGTFIIDKLKIEQANMYANGKIAKFEKKADVVSMLKNLTRGIFNVDDALTGISTRKESPPPPFITSSLQQQAYCKLGFSAKKTMKVAQELYEAGKITYMRTDSMQLSNDALKKIKAHIVENYGESYVHMRLEKKSKSKNSQEAHEAIRPSKFSQLRESHSKDQKALYELIFNRTIASQMIPAKYQELSIHIKHDLTKSEFIGKAKALVDPGYLRLYNSAAEPSLDKMLLDISKRKNSIKPIEIVAHNVWTVPPSHFNESKVIKTLETLGIGRPSTYASILDKLFERRFIIKKDIKGLDREYIDYSFDFKSNKLKESKNLKSHFKESSAIVPTDSGTKVHEFLNRHFEKIINVDFTSMMESDLDAISNGDKKLSTTLDRFYKPFIKEFDKLKTVAKENKQTVDSFTKELQINGDLYTVRHARYGPVIHSKKTNRFTSLTPFLKDTNKDIEDVNARDVKYLTSLPITIDSNRTLHYGRYGFYVTFAKEQKNMRVYKNMVEDVLRGKFDKFNLR